MPIFFILLHGKLLWRRLQVFCFPCYFHMVFWSTLWVACDRNNSNCVSASGGRKGYWLQKLKNSMNHSSLGTAGSKRFNNVVRDQPFYSLHSFSLCWHHHLMSSSQLKALSTSKLTFPLASLSQLYILTYSWNWVPCTYPIVYPILKSLEIGVNFIQIMWVKKWEEILAKRKIKVQLSK